MEYLWNTKDEDVAKALSEENPNCIGPTKGRAAQPATEETSEQPAVGETDRWYINILSEEPLERPEGVDETDEATSVALLGRWA